MMAMPISHYSDSSDFYSYKKDLKQVFPNLPIYSMMDDYEMVIDVTRFYRELTESNHKESQSNIELFVNTPIEKIDMKLIKMAYSEYATDYNNLPKGMDATNPKYDKVKGEFYNKYYDFAQKCKEIIKSPNTSISGYGRNDYLLLRALDKCKQVDYSFPYGWKQFARK